MLISKALTTYNVQLCFANNGVEGLAAAARERPDLIILDVTMPVMDGVECLMKLKSDSTLRDIPVIMLTAEAGKDNVLKIAKMGVRDYIVKPFTEQALLDRVSRVLPVKHKGADVILNKTVKDPATLLVIDEHEQIVEAIRHGVSSMPWKVVGVSECGAAGQSIAKDSPDAVLISLSLPNQAALNFFRTLRGTPRFQKVPVLGLSIKTATSEHADYKNAGFTGIITKPIEQGDLADKLARFMGLDTSPLYFSTVDSVLFVKIPNALSVLSAADLSQYIEPKTKSMVEAGLNQMIVNLSEVERLEISTIKLVMSLVSNCRSLGIQFRLVGSPSFIQQSKAFEELSGIQILQSVPEALAAF